MRLFIEVVAKFRFSRNLGSFEPIFSFFRVGYIRKLILPTRKEEKIGQNNPKFRRTLNFATTSIISLMFLCSCFTRSQVISRGSFDDVQMGSPVADFEQKVGKPYRIRKMPNGTLDYEYIERIFMGEEIIEENHYFVRVKNGRVIAKRMNQEIPSAYDLIYDADPNDVDLQ